MKVFVRYSEMHKLSEELNKLYPNLHLPKFPTNKWLSNQKS